MSTEETGRWVVMVYWPHEPTEVYGFFNSYEEAWAYARANETETVAAGGSYEAQMVRDTHKGEKK